ncbi:mitochondrial ribonuclease P catalytic subunit-like isoform X2 [Tubulanus polymorphus]
MPLTVQFSIARLRPRWYATNSVLRENSRKKGYGSASHRKSSPPNLLASAFRNEEFTNLSISMADEGDKYMTIDEWTSIQNLVKSQRIPEILRTIWPTTFMMYFGSLRHIARGKSLKEFVMAQTDLPDVHITFLSKYMVLLSISKLNEVDEILESYELLKEKTQVFDINTASDVIKGLSKTVRWKDCLSILEMVRFSSTPTASQYHEIIDSAFRENDFKIGFDLMEQMATDGIYLRSNVLLTLLESALQIKDMQHVEHAFRLLRKYEWYPSSDFANKLVNSISRISDDWNAELASVDNRSICLACRHKMERYSLNQDTFRQLQDRFLKRSIIGRDVFLKSNPSELDDFKSFLEKKAPFDIVVDGLNIAFKHCGRPLSSVLLKLVIYFSERQNKKVLVIGRHHMQRQWKEMKQIEQIADVFYASNISQDDPFLLYAALYSGMNTNIVTSDELRDHRFLLGPELARVLKSWQRARQIEFLGMRGRDFLKLEYPVKHVVLAQQSSDSWHIPFDDGSDRPSYKESNSWICIQRNEIKR